MSDRTHPQPCLAGRERQDATENNMPRNSNPPSHYLVPGIVVRCPRCCSLLALRVSNDTSRRDDEAPVHYEGINV
ncbi:hypothetical protein PISMIDRAFT_683727 [Pisolithus microcarpus 441]|uniref:Uncharacterized protein n=1 Tax=Pisolithus microcarpus 441 TaxID=765257 RepID=A0A0C9Y2E2_9AGAM|nr:hypothetical protein PISMIDRAFT_690233 [Pisolithus microcarpus 441]KIK12013.1 hypothetical protein PISMIDRAFT_689869 [Pisolithus microcarpus 441]KIK18885.1 hypothetical protein PISMIDRAFT_683727 [Pisolithus microcarpus 441]